jgi:hypothetical protein
MLRNILILSLFVWFTQVNAKSFEVVNENIDQDLNYKVDQAEVKKGERSISAEKADKPEPKDDPQHEMKYWKYPGSTGPKY